MNNTCSPFLYPQQVPGTPLYVNARPSTICSPGSCVPDIDDRRGASFLTYGNLGRTPKSAPSTPGMTVPSTAPSPSSSIELAHLKDRKWSARSNKNNSRDKVISSTTPKREQIVPSCSPLVTNTTINMNDAGKKELHSTKQISLFTGDDIFA